MAAIGWFLAALAAIVLIGWAVKKRTGSHMWPLDDWAFDTGETIAWRDDAADVAVIPTAGQARVMHPARLHRWKVITTTTRMILAQKALGGKYVVMFVLWPGETPNEDRNRLDGGLLSTGYRTIVVTPGAIATHVDQGYVALTPVRGERSSTNISQIRIYTDLATSFRLP